MPWKILKRQQKLIWLLTSPQDELHEFLTLEAQKESDR